MTRATRTRTSLRWQQFDPCWRTCSFRLAADEGPGRPFSHCMPRLSAFSMVYLTKQAFAIPGSAVLNLMVGAVLGTPAGAIAPRLSRLVTATGP